MKRIAYIELDTHAEIAAAFREAVKDAENLHVDYYFSQKILKRLGILPSENIFLADENSVVEQVSNHHYDLVVIGTAHRYFLTFNEISKNNPTAVIVHNRNFSEAEKQQLLKSVFKTDYFFRLKLLLKEGLLKAPNIYKNCKKLVLDGVMASAGYTFLPLFYTEQRQHHSSEILTIVVPGTVSQSRRNYLHVFEKTGKFKNPVKLVLLGKADGKDLKMVQAFEQSKPCHVDLVYFKDKVPPQQFDGWMAAADALWCPIQKETEFFGIKEIYGETKMTGNLGDAIKYGKIAVFPAGYTSKFSFIVPEEIEIEQQFHEIKEQKALITDFPDEKCVKTQLANLLNNL